MGKEESGLRKILIVEDDKVLNKTLAYNLTADGYEVTSAYSFQDAVERFSAADRGKCFSDLDSFVVHPLCLYKRYKGDTWRFQCDDSSIFLGCNLFALFSKETIGIYRWAMSDIR